MPTTRQENLRPTSADTTHMLNTYMERESLHVIELSLRLWQTLFSWAAEAIENWAVDHPEDFSCHPRCRLVGIHRPSGKITNKEFLVQLLCDNGDIALISIKK